MKASEILFEFPVLGISTDNDLWGFNNLRELTTCGPRTLRDGMQLGMELVDANGRRWKVTGVRRVGRAKSLLPWLLSVLLTAAPGYRIEQELESLEPLALDQVTARVCSSMQAHPEFWCEDDERETVMVERLKEVREIKAIDRVHEVLGLDTFEPY